MVKKNIRPTAGRPGGCNQRTQPPASTPSQDQRTQKRTRAQPSSATRRQLEDETARHQACMADAMELLEKRRNRKRKRSACANELDRMGSATIADHTVAYTTCQKCGHMLEKKNRGRERDDLPELQRERGLPGIHARRALVQRGRGVCEQHLQAPKPHAGNG